MNLRDLLLRLEVRLLLAGLAVFALVFGFAYLADEVVEGDTQTFDVAVVNAFRQPADPARLIGPDWLPETARDITALGSYGVVILLTLSALVCLVLVRRWRTALLVLVSVGGGMVVSTVLKMGFDRPRPDLSPVARVFTASFPSGHAMLSAVTYLTLGALLARVTVVRSLKVFCLGGAVFLTLLVGSSRVYLGVHYPTDVLAGWCVGFAWALLCLSVAIALQRTGAVEPSTA